MNTSVIILSAATVMNSITIIYLAKHR